MLTALEWVGQAAAAPLPPVRLVCLVTALEVLVLDDHESLGKRSKLSVRVSQIVSRIQTNFTRHEIWVKADNLYHIRSECLHDGETQVDESDVQLTRIDFADTIVAAFLNEPFSKCVDLKEVLDTIGDIPQGLSYSI